MTVRIAVATEPAYEVVVGAGALELARRAVRPGDVELRDGGLPGDIGRLGAQTVIALPAGEEAKGWDGLKYALEALAEERCDRRTTLFAVGGGAALDLVGLAAALYLRGVAAVYCPTTLLAMVDAAVGGKTAINLEHGKNLAGVVRQPRAVFADTRLCATLPEAEYRSGLGEVLKSAVIGGERFLAWLERSAERLAVRDDEAIESAVARCVALKARIVVRDPHERGARRALNLGHTFAHAIEHAAGYGRVPHGIAVAAGVALALQLASRLDLLEDDALPARVAQLAGRLGLPATLDDLRARFGLALAPQELVAAMRSDKKALAARPRFVLPRRAGRLELRVACAEALVSRTCAAGSPGANARARRAGAGRARVERSSPRRGS